LTRAFRVTLAAVLALAVSGCGGPGATFDPSGPCVVDGRTAGAYPDLEARVPPTLDGAAPTALDSGRHCTPAGLGALANHDLEEVRYAGAIWDLKGGNGVSSVVFALPDGAALPAAWIAEFYEAGARAGKKTGNIQVEDFALPDGRLGTRLDVLNDLSLQTIVTWQDDAVARAVLVATPIGLGATRAAHDELVQWALSGLGAGGPAASR
jgi:hypothetical protein